MPPNLNRPLGDELILAFERLTVTIRERSIRYALIGGPATLLPDRPRFTQDIEKGFTHDPATVIPQYIRQNITTIRFGGIRIDWIKPAHPLYAHALKDATVNEWKEGFSIRVSSLEGIILTKLLAFRSQDVADLEALLSSNPTLSIDVIRDEWSNHASTYLDRTAWLEDAFRRLLPAS